LRDNSIRIISARKARKNETSHEQNAHTDKPLYGEFHRILLKTNNYNEMKNKSITALEFDSLFDQGEDILEYPFLKDIL
jgi:hypothetical protein